MKFLLYLTFDLFSAIIYTASAINSIEVKVLEFIQFGNGRIIHLGKTFDKFCTFTGLGFLFFGALALAAAVRNRLATTKA